MIAIGSDHAGFELKEAIKRHLEGTVEYKDYGTDSKESCDFPKIVKPVTNSVLKGECELGILICGTGVGMAITANRNIGIRAALCSDVFSAETSKSDNDANILTFGAEVIGKSLALKIVDKFIETPFSNKKRYKRRLKMLEE